MLELVLVFVLGGVPFIKAGGRDYAALEGDTAAKHRPFRHRFGAAINEIVSAHPECSETTITYDYEDGHTWASYWPEVLAIFAVHTNLNSDSDVIVINNPVAYALLSNSEFVIMLRQSKSLEALERLYGLSKPQLEFLRNASEGHGIIKMGNSMIPFSNLEPKDTAVYKLITTKPGEATAEK